MIFGLQCASFDFVTKIPFPAINLIAISNLNRKVPMLIPIKRSEIVMIAEKVAATVSLGTARTLFLVDEGVYQH